MFVVQQIPDSNLVLVVTQAYCDCSRQYGAILLEPKEIKYILHILSSKMLPPAGCLQPQILQGGQDCIQLGKSHLCCNLLIFPQISDAVHWHSTANDENINRLSEQSHNICLLLAEALKLQIYVMLCFYKISSPLYIYRSTVVHSELPVFLNICEHNATVKCNRMKSQKVRRRPESCHAYHPKVSAEPHC